MQRLGHATPSGWVPTSSANPGTGLRSPRTSETASKPATGQRPNRREDVVRLVRQRPGISIKQIGDELGIDPTGLYRPVRELQQQGAITKQGPRLNPSA
jgi:hypothetical protein